MGTPAGPYVPSPEELNAEFYARAAGGVLHLQRCAACGRLRHPPRYYCPGCSSDAIEWVPSPGRGRLFTWTVTHLAFDRGWADRVPYATGVIELDEGVRLVGALEAAPLADLRIGLPLAVALSPRTPEFVYLALRPIDDKDTT